MMCNNTPLFIGVLHMTHCCDLTSPAPPVFASGMLTNWAKDDTQEAVPCDFLDRSSRRHLLRDPLRNTPGSTSEKTIVKLNLRFVVDKKG